MKQNNQQKSHLRFFSLFFLFLFTLSLLHAKKNEQIIIPKPQTFRAMQGTFTFNQQTTYYSNTSLSKRAINYLQDHLKKNAGYTLKNKNAKSSIVFFSKAPKRVKKAEGYKLSVGKDKIYIEARDKAGFFYAVVSLMQMMDSEIWRDKQVKRKQKNWSIPACQINDYPRFAWRGMMLDTSRNFFSTSYVKKFIDRMAQHKLNRFHWHLTDDEGWRIEIKHYLLLTKVGASRGPGTKLPFSTYPSIRGPKNKQQSGYYSQREIREIVAYAKARCIEILPEIDMPGHAKAAIVAYPKLLQDQKDRSKYRSVQKVSNNTINPAMESTYIFMDNVLKEVSSLFPFDYVHLGGDEVPKGAWQKSPAVKNLMKQKGFRNNKEMQAYFFGRLDRILSKHHKKMIIWQEAAKGKAKTRGGTIFMAWKSPNAGYSLAKKGRQVILSPVQYLYFDQQYIRNKKEYGHTWSTPVSTQKAYSFTPKTSAYVKGVEACLWSETLLNTNIADYLAWPRAFALSELAWTEQKHRKWSDFKRRVKKGLRRLKVQNIHYRGY